MRDGYYVREYGILLKLKLNQMTRCSIDQVIVLMELLYTIDNACSEKCYWIFMFYKQHLLPDDYVIAFETRELHPLNDHPISRKFLEWNAPPMTP